MPGKDLAPSTEKPCDSLRSSTWLEFSKRSREGSEIIARPALKWRGYGLSSVCHF